MHHSIRGYSFLAVLSITTGFTALTTSCLDLEVKSDPSGAGGNGDASSSTGNGASNVSSSSSSNSSSASASSSSSSSSSGMVSACGNNVVESGEQCDDGNTTAGDGCSATCQVENLDNCPGAAIQVAKGQPVVVTGTTTGLSDDFMGSIASASGNCMMGNWTGPDAIYAVTSKDSGQLVVTADANYNNVFLHARSQCPGTPSDQLSCAYGFSAGVVSWTLMISPDTVYYVAVDSFNNSSGEYKVTFEVQ